MGPVAGGDHRGKDIDFVAQLLQDGARAQSDFRIRLPLGRRGDWPRVAVTSPLPGAPPCGHLPWAFHAAFSRCLEFVPRVPVDRFRGSPGDNALPRNDSRWVGRLRWLRNLGPGPYAEPRECRHEAERNETLGRAATSPAASPRRTRAG